MGEAESQATVLGKYRVVAELGHGGMADVYLAVSAGVGGFSKLVVLKLLRNLEDAEQIQMFLEEARLAARLNHPNVVQTYEVANEGELYYMAMDFLDGPSLNRLRKRADKEGGIPLPIALHILSRMLEGLHYAHELKDYDGTPLNVVHRDLSPHNVIVTYDGDAKIVDFGIAKAIDSSVQTQSGIFKGKITYMPPEQVRGEKVDRRADVFAAGIMLWEAIAGHRMWDRNQETVVARRLADGLIPRLREEVPDAPAPLIALTEWTLEPDPQKRCPSALEMQRALDAFLRAEGLDVSRSEVSEFISRHFAADREHLRKIIESQLKSLKEGAASDFKPVRLPRASYGSGSASGSAVSAQTPGTASMGLSAVAASLPPAAPSATRWAPLAAVLGVVAIVGALAVWRLTAPPPAPVVSAPPPVAKPADDPAKPVEAPKPAEPASVILEIRATPPSAVLSLDGADLTGNPYAGRQRRDGAVHRLEVRADGYVTATREVRFDHDLQLELALEKSPAAAVAKPPTRPGKPKGPGQPTDELGF